MDSRRVTLNRAAIESSLKKLRRGTPANRLPQPQLFSIPSRTVVIAKIPYGSGPEELLTELLLRVQPTGNIENLTMSGNTTCYVRYELPIQAKRAVRQITLQITRQITNDLQVYHLSPIVVCLECNVEQKIHDDNLTLHSRSILERSRTLYLRNFGDNIIRFMLQSKFSAYGELARVPYIFIRRGGDRFAFVTYLTANNMNYALLQAQGAELPDGSRLWVAPYRVELAALPSTSPAAL